jgi:tartrate dehydratase alpha subunit/fumarate hydratase class I-like protein
MEQEILKMTQSLGVGAQFGGKYFCHDVRVIRLPRHGASLPIGLGVSCSADRQVLGKITKDGVFSRSSSIIRRNICRRSSRRSAARWSRSISTSR